jgi:hypothetical protein
LALRKTVEEIPSSWEGGNGSGLVKEMKKDDAWAFGK